MALHHAARGDMLDMIELLVMFGADVYASDNLGRKPVDYATSASPAHACLTFYESKSKFHCTAQFLHSQLCLMILFFFFSGTDHPLSLQQLCRISVRIVLGTKASKVIGQLDISPRICSYLQYCDWMSHITGVKSSLVSALAGETVAAFFFTQCNEFNEFTLYYLRHTAEHCLFWLDVMEPCRNVTVAACMDSWVKLLWQK